MKLKQFAMILGAVCLLCGYSCAQGSSNGSSNGTGNIGFNLNKIPRVPDTFVMPSGVVPTPYSKQLTIVGGVSPYQWTIASGSLPAGFTLDKNTETSSLSCRFRYEFVPN